MTSMLRRRGVPPLVGAGGGGGAWPPDNDSEPVIEPVNAVMEPVMDSVNDCTDIGVATLEVMGRL